ncbi:hypothetical protein JCM8097_007675 [Rhodosporidiobolus ruineniae]
MADDLTEKAQQLFVEDGDNASTVRDPEAEKRLVRKLDLVLTPLFFVVYLITFIDRANVGNARVAGLEADLGLVGYQYVSWLVLVGSPPPAFFDPFLTLSSLFYPLFPERRQFISLSIFYVFYALWEMPSNVVCKILGARIWLPAQVFAFGLVCMCTAFVRNFGGFLAVRIMLGIAEGGVLPAMSLVLSRFYKKDELIFRIALFVSAAALAGGFGGLLASGFISAGGIPGVGPAWRTIFFAEGLITIGIAAVVAIFSVSGPEDAWWLTAEQKALATARITKNVSTAEHVQDVDRSSNRAAIFRYLSTPVPWICAFGYLTTNVTVQGVSLFSPTILKAMYPGMSTVQIQLRSVPPYAVAFVWSLFIAFLSAKINRRGIPLLMSYPLALVGYALFLGTHNVKARYAGIFLNILGAFPSGPMWMAWSINCAATDTERSIAAGLVPGFGQFGALIATWTYLPKDAPEYRTGNSMEIGFTCANIALIFLMLTYIHFENRARQAGKRDHRFNEVEGLETKEQIKRLGSRHPAWMFPA